jgi:hypothetical protein
MGWPRSPSAPACTNAFDQEITMNARVSSLRASMAPAALAVAVAMAFGLSAPAQAYTYPGSASSSGHAVKAAPVRAEPRERPAYGAAPARYGYGNPSMQHGEACPPGSTCAPHGPNQQTNGQAPAPSGAYGAHGSYGYAAPQAAHQAATPASRNAIASPVRASAGHGAMNYGPSAASNANFRNSVSGKTSGPNVSTAGQPTSFNGPNGKVNLNGMSNPSVTGPNGQVGMDGPDLNHLGGGYGHAAGAGMNMGGVVNAQNGSISMKQTGGAPGMANGGMDSYKADNGAAGAEKGDRTNPNFKSGQHGANAVYDGWGSNSWFDPKNPQGGGHPENGTDRNGTQWVDNMVWDGTDSNGTEWRNGKWDGNGPAPSLDDTNARNAAAAKGDDKKGGKGGEMPADMGPDAGPGEIVSGTGQVVHPGQKKGQDTGGGQTGDAGTTNSGGQNAQGQYIAPSGQDAPVKPKEVGTLKMDYNGKNGAIDPKVNGTNGGGG